MTHYFQFAGVNSKDHDMYISGNPYVSGARDIEEIAVPGRNGNLTVSNGRVDNVDVQYMCFIDAPLSRRSRGIRAWLMSAEPYQVLSDTYDREYFRFAYCKGPVDFEGVQNRYAESTVTFRCKPMMYSWDGQKVIALSSGGEVINPEAFASRPHFKVYGSGQGTLFIGDQSVTFNDIDEYIEIDSDSGVIYKGTENQGGSVIIDAMPVLVPGNTAISWDGGISNIEIIPRWCTV